MSCARLERIGRPRRVQHAHTRSVGVPQVWREFSGEAGDVRGERLLRARLGIARSPRESTRVYFRRRSEGEEARPLSSLPFSSSDCVTYGPSPASNISPYTIHATRILKLIFYVLVNVCYVHWRTIRVCSIDECHETFCTNFGLLHSRTRAYLSCLFFVSCSFGAFLIASWD